MHQCRLGAKGIEINTLFRKISCRPGGQPTERSEQCPSQPTQLVANRAALAASPALTCVCRDVASRTREVMTPLSFSTVKAVPGARCPVLGSAAPKIKTLPYWSE